MTNKVTEAQIDAALSVNCDSVQGYYHSPKIGPASHVIREGSEELWRMRTSNYETGHSAMMAEIERIKMRRRLSAALSLKEAEAVGEEVYEAAWFAFRDSDKPAIYNQVKDAVQAAFALSAPVATQAEAREAGIRECIAVVEHDRFYGNDDALSVLRALLTEGEAR